MRFWQCAILITYMLEMYLLEQLLVIAESSSLSQAAKKLPSVAVKRLALAMGI